MKKYIVLVIFIIGLVLVSGCTQQATTTPVTTAKPTEVPTAEATTVGITAAETTVVTPAGTVAVTTVIPPVNETTVVPATTEIVTAGMTPSTQVTVIHIVNNSFSPSVIMLLPGSGISWINDDKTVHSLKMIGDHKGMFNSGDIMPAAQWHYAFGEKEGTYEYADGYDMNVTGIIIIKKGASFYGIGTPTTYMTSNATW